ncbi:MAG: hypothetical protein ABFD60_17065 [Bryobacteraceae bacterium]
MACPDFEELLRQGPGGHAAHCEECGALLEAWTDVDSILNTAIGNISAPPSLAAAVRMRIAREEDLRRPTPLPEILDFIGWAAVLTLCTVLVPLFLPLINQALAKLS